MRCGPGRRAVGLCLNAAHGEEAGHGGDAGAADPGAGRPGAPVRARPGPAGRGSCSRRALPPRCCSSTVSSSSRPICRSPTPRSCRASVWSGSPPAQAVRFLELVDRAAQPGDLRQPLHRPLHAHGLLLAILLDQKIRRGHASPDLPLPMALSAPSSLAPPGNGFSIPIGLEQVVQNWGFETFRFGWIKDRDLAIYYVVIAAVAVDRVRHGDVPRRAARHRQRDYQGRADRRRPPPICIAESSSCAVPRPAFLSAFVVLAHMAIKSYDLVIMLTGGGPGVRPSCRPLQRFPPGHLHAQSDGGRRGLCGDHADDDRLDHRSLPLRRAARRPPWRIAPKRPHSAPTAWRAQ